ncbi:MAG TPA: hypothetical protein VGG39_25080 [Polyangiaceae bacterium]|jgi:hypothetical protein
MKLSSTCLLACAALALSTSACSTHYVPRDRGRIAIVMDPSLALARDGKTYHLGIFGGDVDEAVAGNPRAEAEASTYQTDQTVGSALSFAGLAAVIAGAVVFGGEYAPNQNPNALPPSAGLLLGGVIASMVGLGFTLAAQPHLWDAINIYNDDPPGGPRAPVSIPLP